MKILALVSPFLMVLPLGACKHASNSAVKDTPMAVNQANDEVSVALNSAEIALAEGLFKRVEVKSETINSVNFRQSLVIEAFWTLEIPVQFAIVEPSNKTSQLLPKEETVLAELIDRIKPAPVQRDVNTMVATFTIERRNAAEFDALKWFVTYKKL